MILCSPGVVYLTRYVGTKMPRLYIGSSTEHRVLNGYRGTVTSKRFSAIWNSELLENPQLFKTRILSRHSTRKAATVAEASLQKKFDVIRSARFINMSIASPNGFYGPCRTGVSSSEEHCEKISSALKGRSFSDAHRAALAIARKTTVCSQKTRLKLSSAGAGANNGMARSFLLIDPVGVQYTVNGQLRKFCSIQSLSFSKMYRHIDAGVIPVMDSKRQPLAIACTGWKISSNT